MKGKVLKNFLLVISLSTVIALLAVCGTGCGISLTKELVRHDYGYFQYVVVEETEGDVSYPHTQENNVVAIVGFTESGMEQEVIDIPREIDGKPVRFIGCRKFDTFYGDSYYHLNISKNLKKVYIHENIKSVYREAFYDYQDDFHATGRNIDIMICAAIKPHDIFAQSSYGTFYIYKSIFGSNKDSDWVHGANIVFINNYSDEVNEGYYSLDNIDAGEKIPVPSNPERSGYEFTGWYEEAECINAWDFDVSPNLEEDEEFRLYAGWREL